MLLPVLASLDSATSSKILEDSFDGSNRHTTIDSNVLFFKKRRHSDDDLLYLDRDFAALCHGDVEKRASLAHVSSSTSHVNKCTHRALSVDVNVEN